MAKPPDPLGCNKPQLFGKTVMPRWRDMGVYWQENGLVNVARMTAAKSGAAL
jgi:hypothetical protein